MYVVSLPISNAIPSKPFSPISQPFTKELGQRCIRQSA